MTEFPQVFDLGPDGKGMSYVASLTQDRITQRAASTARYQYFILLKSFCPAVLTSPFSCSLFSSAFLLLSLVLFPTLLSFFPMELLWAEFPGEREIHCGKTRCKVAKLAMDFSQNVSRFFVVTRQDWSEFLLTYLCKDLFYLNWLLTNVTYQKVTWNNMFLLFLFSELLIPITLDLLFTLHQFQGTNPKLSI